MVKLYRRWIRRFTMIISAWLVHLYEPCILRPSNHTYAEHLCRQRGREEKSVVFTTTLIESCEFNPHPGHVVASLDKMLYDDYLCLVASNKQQIQWKKIWRNPHEH